MKRFTTQLKKYFKAKKQSENIEEYRQKAAESKKKIRNKL